MCVVMVSITAQRGTVKAKKYRGNLKCIFGTIITVETNKLDSYTTKKLNYLYLNFKY